MIRCTCGGKRYFHRGEDEHGKRSNYMECSKCGKITAYRMTGKIYKCPVCNRTYSQYNDSIDGHTDYYDWNIKGTKEIICEKCEEEQ